MTKNFVYAIVAKANCPLKLRFEEHQKTDFKKSDMADNLWREKEKQQTSWKKVKIIDKKY